MFTNEQIEDLEQLQDIAERFGAKLAIIGAAALLCFIDLGRFTRDIDIVVALDLEDFTKFSAELRVRGWSQEKHREHRWRGPRGSIVDLMPAGPKLRAAKRIVWPESQLDMSLVGFEHVFTGSIHVTFADEVRFNVAPPPIIALLKIIAYTEDYQRRQRDLLDLQSLLHRYEATSERIFSDDVFAAELEDIEYANAFLLGLDIGAIMAEEEARIVEGFLLKHQLSPEDLLTLDTDDLRQREMLRFQRQLVAFNKGIECSRKCTS